MAFGRTSLRPKNKPPSDPIGELRYRVTLCSADDIVVDGATMVLARRKALDVWAAIDEKRGSQWSSEGFAVKENRDQQSHIIGIRQRREFEIKHTAWIYHARRDLPARWFKVLSVTEKDATGIYPWFWSLSCRLVEKSDFAAPPQDKVEAPSSFGAAMPVPNGVIL